MRLSIRKEEVKPTLIIVLKRKTDVAIASCSGVELREGPGRGQCGSFLTCLFRISISSGLRSILPSASQQL